MKKFLVVLAALALMSTLIYAQGGVAGKWTGEMQGRGGTQPVSLEVKDDGGKVSGTMTQGQNATPIADAKIDGAKISFKTTLSFGGNEIQISWSGEVKGDDMTLNREVAGRGGAGPITLKRAK